MSRAFRVKYRVLTEREAFVDAETAEDAEAAVTNAGVDLPGEIWEDNMTDRLGEPTIIETVELT